MFVSKVLFLLGLLLAFRIAAAQVPYGWPAFFCSAPCVLQNGACVLPQSANANPLCPTQPIQPTSPLPAPCPLVQPQPAPCPLAPAQPVPCPVAPPQPVPCPVAPAQPAPCTLAPSQPAPCPVAPSQPVPCPLAPSQPAPCPVAPSQPAPCPLAPSQPAPCPLAPSQPAPCPVALTQPAPCPVAPSLPAPCPLAPSQPAPCPVAPAQPAPCPLAPSQPAPCPVAPSQPAPCPVAPSQAAPCQPVQPQPIPLPIPPVTPYPPVYPEYTPEPYVPLPTTQSPKTTTKIPTRAPTSPPEALIRCPEGTVLLNGKCRLVYCSSRVYANGRCVEPRCPPGTYWTGHKCDFPKDIELTPIHLHHTIINEKSKNMSDLVLNNVQNLKVNASVTLPTDYRDYEEDYDEEEDVEVEVEVNKVDRPKCCTVVAPRICCGAPGSDRWHCYNPRQQLCGDLCTAPKVVLNPPSVNSWSNNNRQMLTMPPNWNSACQTPGNCIQAAERYDCSGCARGVLSSCSTYCYSYQPCTSPRCVYTDQQQFCGMPQYAGHFGCRSQDGWQR